MNSGAVSAEKRLHGSGIILPKIARPVANYATHVRAGNLIFLSGQGPQRPDGSFITGKLGIDLSVEQGYDAARIVGLQILALLREAASSLDNVRQVVKLLGMVNAAPGFTDHPKVINGCSDVLVAILGEQGRHARSAVGMGSLPGNMAVEVEAIVEISS